jgi:hypothetical protein
MDKLHAVPLPRPALSSAQQFAQSDTGERKQRGGAMRRWHVEERLPILILVVGEHPGSFLKRRPQQYA